MKREKHLLLFFLMNFGLISHIHFTYTLYLYLLLIYLFDIIIRFICRYRKHLKTLNLNKYQIGHPCFFASESIINFEIDATTNQVTTVKLHGIIPLKNVKCIRHSTLHKLKTSNALLYLTCCRKLCRFMQIYFRSYRYAMNFTRALIFIRAGVAV